MASLNFAQLAAAGATLVPSGSIVDDATNGIMINIGTFIGETVDSLTDAKVVEFCSRLLEACYAAQLKVNANTIDDSGVEVTTPVPLTTANQVTSFANGSFGAVQSTTAGDRIAVLSQTMTSRVTLNTAERLDNLGAL